MARIGSGVSGARRTGRSVAAVCTGGAEDCEEGGGATPTIRAAGSVFSATGVIGWDTAVAGNRAVRVMAADSDRTARLGPTNHLGNRPRARGDFRGPGRTVWLRNRNG